MTEIQPGFVLTRHNLDKVSGQAIALWLATPAGPARLLIENEETVFFITTEDLPAAKQVLRLFEHRYRAAQLQLKTFGQKPVAGLYFSSQRDSFDARVLLETANINCFETDIRPPDRYLMERFCYGSIEFTGNRNPSSPFPDYCHVRIRPSAWKPSFKVISLDIECSMQGELYCIGLYGHQAEGLIRRVLMIGTTDNEPAPDSTITLLPDEKHLLQALVNTIQWLDPDIIIGWNVINFDFQLLLQRAALAGVSMNLGRDGSKASWRKNRTDNQQGFISIAGRIVIDGIDALKTATYSFPSFSLDAVAQALLGRGKQVESLHNRHEEITRNFLHDKAALAAYNLEDCILVWDIFQKTSLLDFLIFRSQLTGLELDKQGGSVAAFTNLYLPLLHRAGYIAPNLPEDGGIPSPGGYVMESRPGLYRNVVVLDYKSLYPSIIRTFLVDPLGLIEGLQNPDTAVPGFRGGCFSRTRHLLPDIITRLWQERDEAKRVNDAARSQALKIIMNSFYGVLGSGGCRFYDPRLASSITLRGHQIMQQTAQWIEAMGYAVIYGDTDSTFLLLPEDCTPARARAIALALQQEINDNWRHKLQEELGLESFLEIEFDCHYTRFLMPTIRGSEQGSKKRYAGLRQHERDNGTEEELVFRGLENVRTDWTDLAKNFQYTLFDYLFHDRDPRGYIQEILADLRDGKLDAQLVYRKRLRQALNQYVKNVPPHVRAARHADAMNREKKQPLQYQNRGWISYVMTTRGPEALEYQENPPDYEHYIERQLRPVAEAILPFAGMSFDSRHEQQIGLFTE